jgi:E3 ubiquitin-protein ligase HUWE1
MIHGSAVDITDTGIDPTFLEALPDDMREEVLNQHVRDQQAARVERPPDSQISSEFLDALPPEIRAEIIQQEALERSRRRPEDSAARVPAVGEPADIDPASFIASLDPSLRQAVLMDQDDGFIQTLPSHMIAEAGVYRDEVQARRPHVTRNPTRAIPAGTAARKYTVQHDAILLLDRTGITVLVRLLFFPQVLKKALLFKVLVNLCENAKTRTELFNILLSILQDGTGDLAAVDKSFSQMSVRNRDSKPLTPKAIGKQKATTDYLSALALPASQIETVPDLIAQRCLEALTYIVSNNQLSSVFFLTEHDLPAGLRRAAIKKGKGKEKQVSSQSHYPLVLLLNLLDRQNLLRTPAILESVVNLLATITRPLSTLKEDHKVVAASGSTLTAQPSAPSETVSDSAPVDTATNAVPEILPPTQPSEHPADQGTGKNFTTSACNSLLKPHR